MREREINREKERIRERKSEFVRSREEDSEQRIIEMKTVNHVLLRSPHTMIHNFFGGRHMF